MSNATERKSKDSPTHRDGATNEQERIYVQKKTNLLKEA